ncbi:hypothetical protein J3Q64DRAFT_1697959 [Phycomyces blakesleeanus]|uniref:Uncharacterized protein n=2 Tax=Phycomyces blakesleeanus TaxID=4837 RepID=A0A163A3P7_PHYB8|nr:hypothetical protein PHYBLDRAFT_64075 [Phycomyces blakesleeanus NRRL 1555(-)]OAD70851.1 hypothetical protein PHYBLDRAFT_64075 [Phycomyces blakesleeanus NRRL 1555(-)]|eukprot:XP_018288891.1 hypothetical protein PHYBLDRAFT_64075 [Phycomyces blakesleeanus NRRL 1555(-)]
MARQSRQPKSAKLAEVKDSSQLTSTSAVTRNITPEEKQEPKIEERSCSTDGSTKSKENSERKIRGAYTKNSRTTLWRKRKAAELAEASTKKKHQQTVPDTGPEITIEEHVVSPKAEKEEVDSLDEEGIKSTEVEAITAVYQELVEKAMPRNGESGTELFANTYEHFRHAALRQYFYHLLRGRKKVRASENATFEIWGRMTTYRPKAIRKWAIEYLETGTLVPRKQGQHVKSTSLSAAESEADTI